MRKFIKEILSEASFHSYDNDDILTDKFIKDYIRNNSDGEVGYLLDTYPNKDEYDDEDDIKKSIEFFNLVKDSLTERLENFKEEIFDRIDYYSNKITIYREMTVDKDWIQHLHLQGKRLGIYWSWDADSAEAHWGNYEKGYVALIECEIDEKYINWQSTFEANIDYSFKDEKEITLYKGTPLKIKSIGLTDNEGEEIETDMSKIVDKTFYA